MKVEQSHSTNTIKQPHAVSGKKSLWQRAMDSVRSGIGAVVQTAKENPVETFFAVVGIIRGIDQIRKGVSGSKKASSNITHSDIKESRVDVLSEVPRESLPIKQIVNAIDEVKNAGSLIGLNDRSFLAKAGYSMYDDEVSRHDILRRVVDSEGREKVIDFLQFLIRTRVNQQDGADKYKRAIDIWQSDIDFLKKS